MTTLETVSAARLLLKEATPLVFDCGGLCQRACCRPDESSMNGMLLFPAEEQLYEGVSWAEILPNGGPGGKGHLLVCKGECPRENRPLACRFFPLTPIILQEKGPTLRVDRGARAVCPLCSSGIKGLGSEFRAAARKAAKLLSRDALLAEHLAGLAEIQQEYNWLG